MSTVIGDTCVYLTEEGTELSHELKGRGFSVGETMLKGFSSEEKNLLLDYLERIQKNMKADS